jgi:putative membrane protein
MKNSFTLTLLAVYLLLFASLAVNPYDRAIWWAENLPVLIAVGLLVATYPRFQFSNLAYALMTLFLCYHTIGGHFTFSLTPFYWGDRLLGLLNLDFLFPQGRNNFDRVGHFLVGVFAYPVAELAYRKRWVSSITMAAVLGVFAMGFWGALYEVIEMAFAVIYGGDSGTAFLGSQGDEWDAQKDMLLDLLGALSVSILFVLVWAGKTPDHYTNYNRKQTSA